MGDKQTMTQIKSRNCKQNKENTNKKYYTVRINKFTLPEIN
jgi:hypothetical protein